MKPPNANTESISQTTPQTVIVLELHQIRCDGGTQGRAALNQSVIAEYAELMLARAEFPPVRTWFDGESYWLADGFQRLAAAQSTGSSEIRAEVFYGSLEDARWDSYAANALHGLRRTRADIEVVVTQALRHPNGVRLSNREIARHLNLPETTLRRWRKTSSAPRGADASCTAVRNGKTYSISTTKIGKAVLEQARQSKSWNRLHLDLHSMKELASPGARELLTQIELWVNGQSSLTVCLEGIEEMVRELSMPKAMRATAPGQPSRFHSRPWEASASLDFQERIERAEAPRIALQRYAGIPQN
jgi:hypothetical protein